MKLSEGEKLILMMLSEIYQQLGIKGEIDAKFVQETILRGQFWGLRNKFSGIVEAQAPDPDVVRETEDILWMWWTLEESYDGLSPEDRKRVEVDAAPFGSDVKFPGFDANNEPHYGVAEYWIEHLGEFDRFRGRDLNSHQEHLDSYRRMRGAFDRALKRDLKGVLTADQLIDVLRAQADH
jgi:uncharacterized protein YfbU (UPF0304 family)